MDNILISSLYVCFKTEEELDDIYLLHFLKTERFNRSVEQNVEGGIRSYLFYNNFSNIDIPIPSSKAEQQKIATTLSSLDTLIESEQTKLEQLQEHKKGLMQNLFPQEGEAMPKVRFKEFENDGEWEEKRLEEICHMQAGKFVRAANIKETNEGNLFPCYGGNGLRGYTESHTHTGLYPLIGRQGAHSGNVTLANGKFHATEHAVVATPIDSIDANWLYYKLIALDLNQYTTGQAQPGLSVSNLELISTSVPHNIQEQQKIASTLSSLDNLISSQTERIELLHQHKKGLMQNLFPTLN